MAHLQSSKWPFTIYLVYRSIGTTDLKPWKRRVYFKILISEFKMGLTRAGPGQDWWKTLRNSPGLPGHPLWKRTTAGVMSPHRSPDSWICFVDTNVHTQHLSKPLHSVWSICVGSGRQKSAGVPLLPFEQALHLVRAISRHPGCTPCLSLCEPLTTHFRGWIWTNFAVIKSTSNDQNLEGIKSVRAALDLWMCWCTDQKIYFENTWYFMAHRLFVPPANPFALLWKTAWSYALRAPPTFSQGDLEHYKYAGNLIAIDQPISGQFEDILHTWRWLWTRIPSLNQRETNIFCAFNTMKEVLVILAWRVDDLSWIQYL